MKSIKQLKNLKGKTVLLRVDFNVPIKNGKILDDFRIRKALPTIKFLEKRGAKIILITHLGKDGSESLAPIIRHFSKISGFSVGMFSSTFELPEGSPPSLPRGRAQGRKSGREYAGKHNPDIYFFENIRKFPGEEKNDLRFAKRLASLGDIYVNEAFSVSHRKHASVVGLPKYLPSYAGFQLEAEIKNLSKVFKNPKHPFLYIAGGAKFATKLPLIKKYLRLADHVFVGGSLVNIFLKEKGYEIGKSLLENAGCDIKFILNNIKLILPTDVLIENDTISAGAKSVSLKKINEIKKSETILDVGDESVKNLEELIKKSKLILWNGPLGRYENGGAKATKRTMNFLLEQKGKEIVIGGGDLTSLVPKKFLEPRNYKLKPNLFVSTGGGATLDFLVEGTLPGIKALTR